MCSMYSMDSVCMRMSCVCINRICVHVLYVVMHRCLCTYTHACVEVNTCQHWLSLLRHSGLCSLRKVHSLARNVLIRLSSLASEACYHTWLFDVGSPYETQVPVFATQAFSGLTSLSARGSYLLMKGCSKLARRSEGRGCHTLKQILNWTRAPLELRRISGGCPNPGLYFQLPEP